jgi:hypothetical protein
MTGVISDGNRQLPELALRPERRLMGFDQVADALRVAFAVAVARNGVGAAGGLDANVGPDHAGGDVHGRDLRHGDALFIAAKQARLHAADTLRADNEPGGEKEVALRPAAGPEGLGLSSGGGRGWGSVHGVIVRRRKVARTQETGTRVPARIAPDGCGRFFQDAVRMSW